MKNKIINVFYNFSIALFIASYLIFSFSQEIKKVEALAGYNVGGLEVSATPSPAPSCTGAVAPNCACGTNITTLTPYGGDGVALMCPLVSSIVGTSNIGGYVLGVYSALAPIAIPVGIIGTSLATGT